ncbi:MAG: 2-polyprenyl-6-methoxyphenol hydroxylase-like oxidoreductase [Chloroflexia bacterium]
MASDTTQERAGRRLAVVIGGSMAGLWAAQVLARHFARVAIVDRDTFPDGPEARKGVPQGRHVHVLLGRGMQVAEELFPGITAELAAAGAPEVNWGSDVATFLDTTPAPRYRGDIVTRTSSRPLLEALMRQRLRANPRVAFLPERDVLGLLHDSRTNTVLGVHLRQRTGHQFGPVEELRADLTLDASGRDTKTPTWLKELGYGETEEVTINSFLGYATRWYRPPADFQADWKAVLIFGRFPHHPTGGVIFPIEGNRWIVTLSGIADRVPPTDEAGFREFARTLADPAIYEAIKDAEPLSPIMGYRRTENKLRHYEQLPRWPGGFAALGDSVCAFNPVYGQGMTASGLGALVLDRCLREGRTLAEFQRQLAKSNAIPWTLSTSADFRWPTTVGGTPPRINRFMHRYMDYVDAIATDNLDVLKTFQAVLQMVDPPAALFRPGILGRVIARAILPSRTKLTPAPRRAPQPS